MFFIMGGGQGQKKLDFDQLVVCPGCGKYGHLEVYMVYSYLSLFFIPLFKWGRCYHVRTTCCGRSVAISPELGRAIETGEIKSLPEDIIPAGYDYGSQGYGSLPEEDHAGGQAGEDGMAGQITASGKRCRVCGFETDEDYQFCPKCGEKF